MREFEQMEMQYFVPPDEEMKWYAFWRKTDGAGTKPCFPKPTLRFHDHEKLAHYANAACDVEFNFPFGFKELEGIHSRTDFDLGNHQQLSGKKMQYFDQERNESYVPYVPKRPSALTACFWPFSPMPCKKKKCRMQMETLRCARC